MGDHYYLITEDGDEAVKDTTAYVVKVLSRKTLPIRATSPPLERCSVTLTTSTPR